MLTIKPTLAIISLLINFRSFQCQRTPILPSPVGSGSFLSNASNPFSTTPLSNGTSPGNNTSLPTNTTTPVDGSADFRDPCARLPLTPQLWQSLDLDDYLRNFPGGKNLSLESFAEKVEATNFECGIGKMCNANQICMPVRGRDWYILVAAQNWNSFSNQMYQATAFALSVIQGLASSIVNDYAPHRPDVLMIGGTFMGDVAGLFGAIPGFVFPSMLAFFGGTLWPFIQGGTGFATGLYWTYHNVYASLPSDEFSKTMDVSYLLSKAQAETQAKLSDATKKVIVNGISTEEGLYGALKGGVFLNNHFSATERSEDEIKEAISAVARARLVAAIWKATGFFILRGHKPCTQDGPNGALPGDDVFSYCNPDGMMMTIVQSIEGKLHEKFLSAHLLTAKYNLTTQYFVEHSWDCQEKYGSYSYDPYKKTILPANPDAECIVSLAVCDMTRKDIRKDAKKKGALKACRDVGQIPGI
ncbi:hypothetical protein Pst134EB_004227 [Puccinia striiformis f. sp. tritici]|uniref:DUF7872 domain-containing protein n=1 Tax=Puccinia striiformis TaxID=27350 RepID=A0A2S4V6Q4_9BASI|nr:hypothetical protein Pst134EB_004227 [Puccinia striiformis f. sp. tritici]POW05130.1 hypothetical protein PSTT_09886 [Puccinia striiformis]